MGVGERGAGEVEMGAGATHNRALDALKRAHNVQSTRKRRQVRERLHLSETAAPAARPGRGGAGDKRLPRNYKAMAADGEDLDLEGVLPEVAGGQDRTAAQIARLAAGPGGAARQEGVEGAEEEGEEGGGGTVLHLPPANGSEDTYTLLKMYTLSARPPGPRHAVGPTRWTSPSGTAGGWGQSARSCGKTISQLWSL
jgi:hypothetical protein